LGSRQWPLLDIPILSILRTRLDWVQARQRVTNGRKMSLRELKEEFKQTESNPAIKGKMEQDGTGAASSQAPAHDRSGPKSHCVNKGVNIIGRDSPRLALAPIGRLKALRDYGKS